MWSNGPVIKDREHDVRVRLDLAYDGGGFHGWAAQPGLRTVEGELTAALEMVLRVPVSLTVAGRTDTGVHAAGQVAHVDVPQRVWHGLPGRSDRAPGQALVSRLDGVLARRAAQAAQGGQIGTLPRGASDVVVRSARQVPAAFDARFSALGRRYVYRVDDGTAPQPRDPSRRGQVMWAGRELDVEAMNGAMEALIGEHDFLSYCKPREGATTIRTLRRLEWRRELTGPDAGLVTLTVEADAFCHSMVRSLVGASLTVGEGRRPATWPARLLEAASRQAAAPLAPPHGLTLMEVTYPPDDELGAQARRARVLRTLPGGGDDAGAAGASSAMVGCCW